jgi:hypothetical protein
MNDACFIVRDRDGQALDYFRPGGEVGSLGTDVVLDHPQTVGQVFYQLVTRGVIENTEAEYQGTMIRLLTRDAAWWSGRTGRFRAADWRARWAGFGAARRAVWRFFLSAQ